MRGLRYLLVLSGALALALAPAVAHAAPAYVASDPENHEEMDSAPQEIRIVFDTPLDPGSLIVIVDQCNRVVDDGNVVVAGSAIQVGLDKTPKGPYFVRWKVQAPGGVAGGYATGEITFHVESGKYCGPPSARVNGDGHDGHDGHGGGGNGGGHGGHGGGGGGHDGHGGGGGSHGGGHGDHGSSSGSHSGHSSGSTDHSAHGGSTSGNHGDHGKGGKHGNHGNHGNHGGKSKGNSGDEIPVAAPDQPTTFAADDLTSTVTGDAVLLALLTSLVLGAAGGWLIRNLNPS